MLQVHAARSPGLGWFRNRHRQGPSVTPTHVVSPRPNSALLLPLLRRSAQPPSDLRLVAASTFPRASRDDRLERLARVLERLHATHEVYASHLAHAVDAHANIHAHPVDADDPQIVNLRLENFARGLVGRGAPLNRAGLGETRAVARVQFLRRERERERRSGESSSRASPQFQNSKTRKPTRRVAGSRRRFDRRRTASVSRTELPLAGVTILSGVASRYSLRSTQLSVPNPPTK